VWLVEPEAPKDGEEPEEPPRPYYPRRIAGESAGDGSRLKVAGLEFRAELFRWHARGRHGTGVYLLTPAP
jgi:hypothetical protein